MNDNTKRNLAIGGAVGLLVLLALMGRGAGAQAGAGAAKKSLPDAYKGLSTANKTTWEILVVPDGIMLDSAVQRYDLQGEPLGLPLLVEDDYWIVYVSRDLAGRQMSEWPSVMRELVEGFMVRAQPSDNVEVRVEGGSAGAVLAVTETINKLGIPYSVTSKD